MLRPAKSLFAFEFNESIKYGAGEYISPLGEIFNTVSVAGAVTAVDTSRVSGKVTARISDPTGVFLVDCGKKDSSTGRFFTAVSVPSFVTVTGRAASEDGMQIIAEAAVSLEREIKDSWTGMVLRETIRKIEISVDNDAAKNVKDLCRYAGLLERVFDAIETSPKADAEPAPADYSQKVLEMIDLHSGDRGVLKDELIQICKSSGLSEADIKRTIDSLVEEGECYLPAGGYIRRL